MRNKATILKTLKTKKKVRDARSCQDLCAGFTGCTHFKWKYDKKMKKRACWLQAITYVNKKNYYAGPVSC